MRKGRGFFLLVVAFTGCASSPQDEFVRQLEKANSFELYSLEPFKDPDELSSLDEDPTGPGERLHGWRVLGKTTVSDDPTRRVITRAFKKALDRGTPNKCFYPRHAIRITDGDTTIDLVICFGCENFSVCRNEKWDDGPSRVISRELQPTLDEALTRAGIPLAKKSKAAAD